MKKAIIFSLPALCFALAGCYSDKGNYTYGEVNEVTITGMPEEKVYAYTSVDEIHASPQITGSLDNDPDNYSYLWEAIVTEGSVDGKTVYPIAEGLELDYLVVLPPGEYTVYLNVTDKTSGISWREGFPLAVNRSPLDQGWLILSDADGFCRLDMVSYAGAEVAFVPNVWYGTPFAGMKGPRQIIFNADMSMNHGVYLISDDGDFRLNGDDLGYDEANNMLWEFGAYDPDSNNTDLKVRTFSGILLDYKVVLVTDNGDIYAKNTQQYGGIYMLPINKIAGEAESFRAAPAIGMAEGYMSMGSPMVMYDETNRRFVQVAANLRSVNLLPKSAETVFAFDTGKKFVWMDAIRTNNTLLTILEDDGGKFWMHGLRLPSYGLVSQDADYYFQIDAPEIENATAFAAHPLRSHLFYAVGNKIYQYSMTQKEARVLPLQLTPGGAPVYELAGEQITMLKFNIYAQDTYGKKPETLPLENYLIVGSHSTSGGELSGKVRLFNTNAQTDQPAELIDEYSGFGKVVDVTFREPRAW